MLGKKKTLGLALSGGSLRGAAHIGVLKVLKENGILPDYIAGTSAGSIVASLFVAGLSFNDIETAVVNVKKKNIVDWSVNFFNIIWMGIKSLFKCSLSLPLGLIKGNYIENLLFMMTKGMMLNQISMPLAITATDINSGERIIFTGKEYIPKTYVKDTVFIDDATIAEACRASISIPGVFAPKKLKNRYLVDGGIKDNVPVDILRIWGADVVLAVDLKFASQDDQNINTMLEILLQSADIMGQSLSDCKLDVYADLVIDPEIYDMGLLEFTRIPEAIEKGERATRKIIPRLRELLET
ncbi:MAG: hypothetical protein PWQ82_724 [Thermosediminibacterales bacterium]|nr:hypothetical protein [Thermosediminibacterales bacterium]